MVDFEIGKRQQERRFGGWRAEEGVGAVGQEVGAVAVGEMDCLAIAVEEVALVGVRGPLQGVGRLPQIGKSAAIPGFYGAAGFGRGARLRPRQMPLADVVGGVAGLLHHGGQRGGILGQAQGVSPDAVLAGILARDGKKGLPQIEYGLLTDPAGRPVAVRVFGGNTADPTAFTTIVQTVRDTFKLTDMVMVGDRGMITSARVQELRDLGGFGWVTALRAPAIAALAADDGPLQMSLFDQVNLAEITHPDYPGERLIACRNPALATERARRRLALLAATDTELAKIVAAVAAGRLAGSAKIGIRVGKVVGRYKMAKHYTLDITDDQFAAARNEDQIAAEAALDGIYVIRTTIGPEQMDPAKVVATYKSLSRVERDFRSIKSIDLDLRPIHHWTESRVRAHVFICMLASYLTWHLRQAWAPLTFTDENRPDPVDPVAPAQRSHAADHKAATKTTTEHLPATSFTALLDHLGCLARVDLRYGDHDTGPTVPTLAEPTPTQRRAFELLGAPIPLTLK